MKTIFLFLAFSVFSFRGFPQETKIFTTAEVDSYPYLKEVECADRGSKACFIDQLNYHITEYFKYPMEALKKNWTGNVYIQFVIDSTGKVTDIRTRSNYEVFEKEGIRISQKIPTLEPAKVNGKPVAMVYNFPMVFNFTLDGDTYSQKQARVIDFSKVGNKIIRGYDEMFSPPIYGDCNDADDKATCFRTNLTREIADYVQNNGYKTKLTTSAKIYFELGANKSISNTNIISVDKNLKIRIEQFFNGKLNILEAAKTEDGSPKGCFFSTDIYFTNKQN